MRQQLLGCPHPLLQSLGSHCGKTLKTQLTKNSLFRVLKEQWIRAKYERQEFTAIDKAVSHPGKVTVLYVCMYVCIYVCMHVYAPHVCSACQGQDRVLDPLEL